MVFVPVAEYAGMGDLERRIIHEPSPELNSAFIVSKRYSQPVTVIQNVPQIGLVPFWFLCPKVIQYIPPGATFVEKRGDTI